MKFIFIQFILLLTLLSAQNFSFSKGWHLQGSASNYSDMKSFNHDCIQSLWMFKDNRWSLYTPDSTVMNSILSSTSSIDPMTKLDANDGFWLYADANCTVELNATLSTDTFILANGWNLKGTVHGYGSMDLFNHPDINTIWKYSDSKWSIYSPSEDLSSLIANNQNLESLITLEAYDGFWIHAKKAMTISDQDYIPITNGTFADILKSTTDNVEDIWNLSFKVDIKDVSSLKLAVLITKENTAYGQIIYDGLSIISSKINSPSLLLIHGKKSTGEEAEADFSNSYDPQNVRSNSISLDNDILTLKLGDIMLKQTATSASSFTAATTYKVQIVLDTLDIVNSKQIIMNDLTYFKNYPFLNNSNSGIEGTIIIK